MPYLNPTIAEILRQQKQKESATPKSQMSAGVTFVLANMFADQPFKQNMGPCLEFAAVGVAVKHDKAFEKSIFTKGSTTATPEEKMTLALKKREWGVYYTMVGALHLHAKGDPAIREAFARNTGLVDQEADEAVQFLATRVEDMRVISPLQWLDDRSNKLFGNAHQKRAAAASLDAAKVAKKVFNFS